MSKITQTNSLSNPINVLIVKSKELPEGKVKVSIAENKDYPEVPSTVYIAYNCPNLNSSKSKTNNTIQELFPSGIENLQFKQSKNVGDCYFLAALHSISNHPEGKNLIANMITKVSEDSYEVQFPGYDDSISVYENELEGDNGKTPVNGDKGVKILEVAYAKMMKEKGTKEDRNSSKILYFVERGFGDDALSVLTGWNKFRKIVPRKQVFDDLSSNPSMLNDQLQYAINMTNYIRFLDKCGDNPGSYILTASAKGSQFASDGKFLDAEKKIYADHDYAITKVDSNNRTITLVNPHDTSKSMEISYWDFPQYFETICGVKKDN